MTKQSAPETAYQFRASLPTFAEKATDDASALRKFSGTAYSGEALRHPYWGQVVFDLATTAAGEKTPILINHDRNQRAGFATLEIGSDIKIADGSLMLDTEHGRAVAAESDAGFPWQMSVHIEPGSIDELKAGAIAAVNGRQITGPATIFRASLIREVSFTPTGVDPNTEAAAMSATAENHHQPSTKGTTMPTIEELQAEVAKRAAGLQAATDAATAAESRATAAESALAAVKRDTRMSAVREMFASTGRQFTDAAAKPYLDMGDEMFSAVAADMVATTSTAPGHLFSEHATSGANHEKPDTGEAFALNPTAIYDAINRRNK